MDPIIRAIEENTAGFLMAMGRAGGGEQRDDRTVRWTIGGSPIDSHNAVASAALGPDETDDVRLAVLGSSPMGHSVYRRLGFEERCRFRIYLWNEASSPPDQGAQT